MIPSIFTENNCKALGSFEIAANQPLSWKEIIERHLRIPGENHYAHLLLYAAAAVRTEIDNIILFWCPCTFSINGESNLIGITTSNLSSQEIISLPIESLFCDFVAIVPLS